MKRIGGIAVLLMFGAGHVWLAQTPPSPEGPPPEGPPPGIYQPRAMPVAPALAPTPAATIVTEQVVPSLAPSPAAGRQESLMTIEWIGPSAAQVGEQAEYTLLIRNTSSLPLHKVQANVQLATGMAVKGTKPGALTEGEVLVWQLGTLLPKQQKSLQLQVVILIKGDVSPRAWVTFTGQSSATLRIAVSEPKLALKVSAPPPVLAGDPVTFVLTVNNAGDGVAGQVKIHADLSEGLEYGRGRNVDFEVGDLAAGESRTVQLVCIARAGGEQKCDVAAASGGSVKAHEKAGVNVLVPRLEVELKGPGVRYVERKATYTMRITNRGEIPACNTTASEAIPAGFNFVSATDGGRLAPSNRAATWFLGDMAPGQVREVRFDLLAVKAGEYRHRVTACSERGFKVEVAQELVTRVEDFSALSLEIAHTDDAIEIGKNTTYEVLVTNAGSKMETDIKLMCILPDKMELKSAQGPARYHQEGNVILFEPVPRLAPRGDIVFQLKMKAVTAGDVRFRAQVASTNLIEPVIQTQAMRIYSDRP